MTCTKYMMIFLVPYSLEFISLLYGGRRVLKKKIYKTAMAFLTN